MAFNDSICDSCGADNQTDSPVCPSCAARVAFTHRAGCDCATCAPVIAIRRSQRGTWDFAPPFRNDQFLDDFQTRIGKPFRFWNVRAEQWEVKPLDEGMVDLIESLLRKYFPRYRVVREREEAAALVAA